MNLPNQITLARLFLAIVFCAMIVQYDARQSGRDVWKLDVCLAIFVIAAVSDVVDGFLARRRNQVTSFGRLIDPFVDKVLICGAFVLLAGQNFVNEAGVNISGVRGWMAVLIIARELLVSTLRGASEGQGREYAATVYGKVKMAVQSVTIIWILMGLSHARWEWWQAVSTGLIWLTVITTLLSMVPYLVRARHLLVGRARA
ncbi:MAG: CDP-diacylglycerol--glycerol-3-phosphate 3-phosphatidyltransferase [Phycisphaerae bacterium]